MILTFDLNVLLDVLERRAPFYRDSRFLVNWVRMRKLTGIFPAHGVTTIYYVVRRFENRRKAEIAVDLILKNFRIGQLNEADWRAARNSALGDFEDAVVEQTAVRSSSAFIITRDPDDFRSSSIPAISPTDSIRRFAPGNPP